MASTKPLATASPSPTPSAAVAQPLERLEDAAPGPPPGCPGPGRRPGGRPGPPPRRPRSARGRSGPDAAMALAARLATARSSRAGSAWHPGQRLVEVDVHGVGGTAEAGQRGRHDLLVADRSGLEPQRPALEPAHVEEVPHQVVEAVALLVDGAEELVRGLLGPVDVALQQAGDRRLDRRQRRAQVVRHGPQQRHPQLVGPARSSGLGGRAPRWPAAPRPGASCSASTSACDRSVSAARAAAWSTRKLTSAPTTRNTSRASAFSPSAIVKPVERRGEEPVGGTAKPPTAAAAAGPTPPTAAATTTSSR